MTRIEDYWEDTKVYYIQFKTIENKKISKTIVMNIEYSLKEVEDIVLLKFHQVKEVILVEEMGESLSLR